MKTFHEHIADNKRKSVLLVVCFILFTVVIAMVLALAVMAYIEPTSFDDLPWGRSLLIGGIAAAISFLISMLSFFQGDQIVLAVSGAKEIQKSDDPELFNVVEEMAIAGGLPMPRVYLIHDDAPNAFATGRNPQHASVAITTGLRRKLTRDELQGVMAHEMAHVRNYDIRLMLLLAVLIGTIVMLCDIFWHIAFFGGRGRSRRSDNGKGGGGAAMIVLIIIAVVLAILAPLLARIIQMAVSRNREYLADASAVELTRNPLGLAGALRKLADDPAKLDRASRGTAHLYIVNPVKKFAAKANSMFSSHPPIDERIRRLEALAHVRPGGLPQTD